MLSVCPAEYVLLNICHVLPNTEVSLFNLKDQATACSESMLQVSRQPKHNTGKQTKLEAGRNFVVQSVAC